MNIGARALSMAHHFNEDPADHAFDYVPQLAIPLANELYKQYQHNSTSILQKFESLIKPQNFFDKIEYFLDAERAAKHGAVKKVLLERLQQE